MIVAPHTGFSVRHQPGDWDIIPPVRPMVDSVQEEPFMVGAARQVGWSKKGAGYGKAGSGISLSAGTEKMAEAQQSLRSNGACGRVDRLIRIGWLCVPLLPISKSRQSWRAS